MALSPEHAEKVEDVRADSVADGEARSPRTTATNPASIVM